MSITYLNSQQHLSCWVKYFSDDTTEVGTDDLISEGKASWTKGRLSNIESVYISDLSNEMQIDVKGKNVHQFDEYEARVGGKTDRVARVIQVEEENGLWTSYVLRMTGEKLALKDCKKGRLA